MSRPFSPFLLAVAMALGCDRTAEFADCTYSDDPTTNHPSGCLKSVFQAEGTSSRDVSGFVWRADLGVAGAIVMVEPSAGYPRPATLPTTVTGKNGAFGQLPQHALRYDLTVRSDNDLLLYRNVASRYIEPAIDVAERGLPSAAWRARVVPRLDTTIPEDHTVAFFASGERALGLAGDLRTGLTVYGRDYVTKVTLHAVEFETARGLLGASAYGKVDALLTADSLSTVLLHLEPITGADDATVTVKAPEGFVATETTVRASFAGWSEAPLVRLPFGVATKLPLIPNATYLYRVHATRGAEYLDTGDAFLSFGETVVDLKYPPPRAEQPADGASLGAGDPLVATGVGVLEHVLVPEAEGPSIRIIVAEGETTFPNFGPIGLRPVGPYTWTVRDYPALKKAEELTGTSGRKNRESGAAAPRRIQLR